MMLGSKDAIRIVPYFVLPQFYPIFAYREADAPLLCSYRGGSLSPKTTPVQAHRGFRLLTLASLYKYKKERKTKNRSLRSFFTEKEGFEPSRRVTDLLVFEARPFSHLGTSPKISYI